jgi:DNA repair protein RadD
MALMQLALLGSPSPKIEPRSYQVAAVEALFANWAQRPASSQLIIAPTGSGKTILIGMACERHLDQVQGGRVLSLAHVPELIEQGYTTFRRMCPGMSAGIYAAKLGRKDRRAKVTFALVQSVARNPQAFRDVSMIIIDEAHLVPHSSDGQYRDVIEAIRQARGGPEYVKILGLTATPWRLNSGNLLEPYKDAEPLFDEIAYEIDMLDLLEEGHLCRVVAKGSQTKLDTTGVAKRMGEYAEREMDAKFNTDAINAAIAKEIVEAGVEQGRRSWLVFCITVDHARRMAELIRGHGVSCEMVCGETPTAERRRIIQAFKSYKIRCLTSVNVLSTGFDHPGVDLGAMVRPTASPGLYLQQAGRLLRTTPGKKDALLLDFAMNVFRHGLLTNVKGVFKKAKEDDGPKVRECPKCDALNEPGAKLCANCGYEWPPMAPIERGNAEEKLSKHNLADRVMDEAVWAPVISATYRHIERPGKPAMLQLTYQIQHPETSAATEIWCFDHPVDSWAAKKARAEWYKRTRLTPPNSVIEAAQRIAELRRPSVVRVVNSDCGKYWNVKGVRV